MVLTQAANKTGLPVQAVEKDLWVTVVLQMVFAFPSIISERSVSSVNVMPSPPFQF